MAMRLIRPSCNLVILILKGVISLYQLLISPLLGPRCRHFPSCSEYASEALEKHGVVRGSLLALWRVLRCNPLGTQGFDPVPDKKHG